MNRVVAGWISDLGKIEIVRPKVDSTKNSESRVEHEV